MKIGITGWNGFIGSHLLKRLEETDNTIIPFKGNLRNLDDCQKFVRQCDRIYHIAGKNRGFSGHILANNLVATGNLVLACKSEGIEPEFIFASSIQSETNSNSEFGFTKSIEHDIVKRLDHWNIFIIPNVYGEDCKPFYNSVVATFAYQITHNQECKINNPDTIRDFIYIEDLIDYLLKPIFQDTYNGEYRHDFNSIIYPHGETFTIQQVYNYMTTKLGEHEKLEKTLNSYRII